MYSQTVTLFNYLSSIDKYAPTLIENIEVQPIYRTTPNLYQTDDVSRVLIIVPYAIDEIGKYIFSNGYKKYYKNPKLWGENINYFTLQNNLDFVIYGDFSTLSNPNLNEVKNDIDDVFLINEIRDFPDDLKHFELTCN